MSWLGKIVRALGRVLGVVSDVRDLAEDVEDLTSTSPATQPSRQLSAEDIRRQQQQIASATGLYKQPPKR